MDRSLHLLLLIITSILLSSLIDCHSFGSIIATWFTVIGDTYDDCSVSVNTVDDISYVTGYIVNSYDNVDVLVMAINPTGDLLFSNSIGLGAIDRAYDSYYLDGSLYIVGYTTYLDIYGDIFYCQI